MSITDTTVPSLEDLIAEIQRVNAEATRVLADYLAAVEAGWSKVETADMDLATAIADAANVLPEEWLGLFYDQVDQLPGYGRPVRAGEEIF